jgi:rhodanese-related sulfurtransferase
LDEMNQQLCHGRFSTIEHFRFILKISIVQALPNDFEGRTRAFDILSRGFKKALGWAAFDSHIADCFARNARFVEAEFECAQKSIKQCMEKCVPPRGLTGDASSYFKQFMDFYRSTLSKISSRSLSCAAEACIELQNEAKKLIDAVEPEYNSFCHIIERRNLLKSVMATQVPADRFLWVFAELLFTDKQLLVYYDEGRKKRLNLQSLMTTNAFSQNTIFEALQANYRTAKPSTSQLKRKAMEQVSPYFEEQLRQQKPWCDVWMFGRRFEVAILNVPVQLSSKV